jgi:bifunctional DNase/RNase
MSEDKLIRFTVRGLAIEPKTKNPILLLQDPGGRLLLPIWVGASEASAILVHVEGKTFPRPFTHDLFHNVVESLNARVVGLEIWTIDKGTFKGNLLVQTPEGRQLSLDCRPSDGVAMAVRADAPIWVAVSVLAAARLIPDDERSEPETPTTEFVAHDDAEGLARLLERFAEMKADDFSHEL